jgi:hypothetical protein
MLHLNTIFEAEGLDLGRIQLIRHKDDRLQKRNLSTFEFWYSNRQAFEVGYQNVQSKKHPFDVGGLVASFVVTNTNQTVFVGFYETLSRRPGQEGERLSFLPDRVGAADIVHEMRRRNDMQEYVERLVIEPWKDAINYVKRATAINPLVLEIQKDPYTEPFPTYITFRRRVGDLPKIPPAWRGRLIAAKGIYLLTFADGQLYVGSASGDQGFWQRWSDYIRNGHGGNRILIRENRDARDADVSILEVTGSSLTKEDIIGCEMNLNELANEAWVESPTIR